MTMNTPEAPEPTTAPAPAPAPVDSGAPRVKWNTNQLKSSYVNFANANSTQEEVVLNFGMNSHWDRMASEVEIELTHRIVMSPFAAKRLAELMNKLVTQYENRYGKMK